MLTRIAQMRDPTSPRKRGEVKQAAHWLIAIPHHWNTL